MSIKQTDPTKQKITARKGGLALPLASLILVVAVVFFPLFRHITDETPFSDFPGHSVLAEEMRVTGRPPAPHFLYHSLLIGVQKVIELFDGGRRLVFPISDLRAAADPDVTRHPVLMAINKAYDPAESIAAVVLTELLCVIIFSLLIKAVPSRVRYRPWLAALLSLCLLLVNPLAVTGKYFYMGYIGINIWHNPTLLAVKPLAVLSFCTALALFVPRNKTVPAARLLTGTAVLTLAVTLAKPNWTMCLMPAITIWTVIALARRQRVDWLLLWGGFVGPAAAVLLWQYHFEYFAADQRVAVSVAPLAAMGWYLSESAEGRFMELALKFVLSIVFPASVYLSYRTHALRSIRVNLAWLAFIIGALWAYLIAETGRVNHLNFTWGAQIALFVLFVESALFALGQIDAREGDVPRAKNTRPASPRIALTVCAVAFVSHVISGVLYYRHMVGAANTVPGWYF